jgi:hypothetical protein
MTHSRPGTVNLTSFNPPILPSAMPEAGVDYFMTQAHYRSLASRIITVLGGFNVVVVTGDLLSGAPVLTVALDEAAAGRHSVTGFSYGPKQGRRDVMDFRRALSASLASGGAAGEQSEIPAIIVFDDADRLSDEEIEEIFKHVYQRARIRDHRIAAAIFLARPVFLSRLERSVLRFWLAKRLFVARLRFDELGADEIPAFIHHQLPSGEAESIFTDEAIAAIAKVSGGDPAVVSRFSRRMLDSVAANTRDTLVKASIGSAKMVPTDVPLEEYSVTKLKEGPRQNHTAPELGTQLSTRIRRNRRVTLKLCAGSVFCFACVGVVAAVVGIHPAHEDIAASASAPAKNTSAKLPDHESLTSWAERPDASVARAAVSPPEAPAESNPTAMVAVAAPTLEEALAAKTAALPPSLAALRPTAEVAAPTEARETAESTAMPPAASQTGAAPTATAVSPTGTQAPKPTASVPGPPPAQLRLPAAEIAALMARGDTLFALGDVSSARLFYERAADTGEGRAALRLGNTFDPAFLDFTHLRVRGDSAMAASWYGRARELGAAEAEILLKHLEPVSSK